VLAVAVLFATPVLITSITPMTVCAQTQYTARAGSVAPGDQITPSIAKPAQDGFTVIVWQDNRAADDANIYAQMLDNVNGLPQWYPPDGVPVCTAPGMQRNPVASYDSSGGVIICWEDYRNAQPPIDQHSISEIYAQRLLLIDGSADATWGATDVNTPVCSGTGAIAREVRIAGTTDGAYFCWTDYRNSSGYPNYYDKDVFLQYLLTATASWPGGGNWSGNGINVPANSNADQTAPAITLDHVRRNGKYGVYLAFEDNHTGTRQIRAANIDAVGQTAWEGFVAAGYEQRSPRIASTGSFTLEPLYGAVVVWEDARDLALNGWDAYAQRVDEAGNMLWGQGLVLCDAPEDQGNIALAARLDVCGVAWEDSRNALTSGLDVYGNVVDMIGGIAHYAASTAAELSAHPYDQRNTDVDITLDGLWVTMCWEDQRSWPADNSDIYAESFWSGNPQTRRWGVGGKAVSAAKEAQILPRVANNVVAWQDARRAAINHDNTADENVYAQLLGDECDDPTDMHWRHVYVKHHQGADVSHFNFAIDSEGHRYVVWQESRPDLGGEPAVFIQKLDIDGVPHWENGGLLVSDPGTVSEMPDVCVNDDGGAYVCWRRDGNEIMLAQVFSDGQLQGSTQVGTGTEPRVVEDDQYGVYIGYLDGSGAIFVRYNPWMGIINGPVPTTGITNPSHLQLAKNYEGKVWFAVHENVQNTADVKFGITDASGLFVNTVSVKGGIPTATELAQEFDMVVDVMPAHEYDDGGTTAYKIAGTSSMYDLMIAVIEPTAPAVYVLRCWQDNNRDLNLDGATDVSASANPATAFHSPVIAVDSTAQRWFGNARERGGAIVAWSREYPDPVTSTPRYDVETQRVWWSNELGLNPNGTPKWPNAPQSLDQGITFVPAVDIAAFYGDPYNGATAGVVVWETDQALGCVGGYTAIGAQLVKYSYSPPLADPKLWGVNGLALSPGIGNSRQSKPMLKTPFPCPVPYPVPALWLDDRTGPTCLLGSSIVDIHSYPSHTLSWRKAKTTESIEYGQPDRIVGISPNPVSLNTTPLVTVRLAAGAAEVVLRLYDMSGRLIGECYRGIPGANGSTAVVTAPTTLTPGVYLLELRGGGAREVRTIVFTR
jgi:hypothetical protein